MSNIFKKVFLNFQQSRVLERMAIEENYLQYYGDLVIPGPPLLEENLIGKQRILNYLMLYKSIDSLSANYCWEPLAKIGIVDTNSYSINNKSSESDKEIFNNCKNLAMSNILCHKKALLKYALNNPLLISKTIIKDLIIKFGLNNVMLQDICREIVCEQVFKIENKLKISDHVGIIKFQLEAVIEWVFQCEARGIYESLVNNAHFSSSYTPNKLIHQKLDMPNSIDKVVRIFKTNLNSQIIYFPFPRNIYEALEYRESLKIKRFRDVLSSWITCIQNSETNLEYKIRKDILKANKELRLLKRYRNYAISPFRFYITSIGGHIPIISNILTLCDTVGWLYERWATHRVAWIN